ncbi:MAG TPA: hypothetical protein VLX59_13915 [Acidimicrobiales bacterium]|nr:hypothetical protein [Acidimicrobiales bacterium]
MPNWPGQKITQDRQARDQQFRALGGIRTPSLLIRRKVLLSQWVAPVAIRFREITEAYEILSDPARRARYDRNRQPPPPSDLQLPRPAANTDSVAVTPIHAPGPPPGQPMFIGLGPFRTGSAPLIAGPVHVASPTPHGGAPSRGGTELAQLIDAVLRTWRWR